MGKESIASHYDNIEHQVRLISDQLMTYFNFNNLLAYAKSYHYENEQNKLHKFLDAEFVKNTLADLESTYGITQLPHPPADLDNLPKNGLFLSIQHDSNNQPTHFFLAVTGHHEQLIAELNLQDIQERVEKVLANQHAIYEDLRTAHAATSLYKTLKKHYVVNGIDNLKSQACAIRKFNNTFKGGMVATYTINFDTDMIQLKINDAANIIDLQPNLKLFETPSDKIILQLATAHPEITFIKDGKTVKPTNAHQAGMWGDAVEARSGQKQADSQHSRQYASR